MLVLDYKSLFMFFSFAGGGVQSAQGLLDSFPEGRGEEPHVVPDAHLILLQFHAGALEPAGREKWCCCFQLAQWHKEAFQGLEVQHVAEFDSD
jgi:hypothetical protein